MKTKWNITKLDWNISEKGAVILIVGTFFFMLTLTIFASYQENYFDAFTQFYSTYSSLIGSNITPTNSLLGSLSGLTIELSRADRTTILGIVSFVPAAILLLYGGYVIYRDRHKVD